MSVLKRSVHQMPEFVVNALIEQNRSVTCCDQPTRETSMLDQLGQKRRNQTEAT
jgi:hypothetical protein